MDREYFSYLLFYDNNFQEQRVKNQWIIYSTTNPPEIYYDKYPSRFAELMKISGYQCMTINNSNTYIMNTSTKDFTDNNQYSISTWFKISQNSLDSIIRGETRFIPGIEWEDTTGKTVKIKFMDHANETNNVCLTIEFSNYKKFEIFYEQYYQPEHWFHFFYSRKDNIDRIWIDGKLLFETNVDFKKANICKFRNIKLGNPYQTQISGIFEYSYDEFFICNEAIHYEKDFNVPNRWSQILYPEVSVFESQNIDNHNNYEHLYGSPSFYNADKSRWDIINDSLEITRPIYYKQSLDAKIKMINKHNFYDNDFSFSNFEYLDKNEIKG